MNEIRKTLIRHEPHLASWLTDHIEAIEEMLNQSAHELKIVHDYVLQVERDSTTDQTRLRRLEARLKATLDAMNQLKAVDDDGITTLVESELFRRASGFARRNKRDLDEGQI